MNKWYQNRGMDDDIVLCSRVVLLRNLYGYDFSPKMDDPHSLELIAEVTRACYSENANAQKLYKFERLDTADDHRRNYWTERYIVPEDNEFSRPQALLVTENEAASILINGENHLQMQAILRGRQIGRGYMAVREIDQIFEKNLTYAYSRQYGHLTTAPADMGTGMHVSYFMRLPMTQRAGAISAISEHLIKSGFALRAVKSLSAGDAGNVYEIYNKKTLGVTEDQILQMADSFADQLVRQERELRSAYLIKDRMDFTDPAYKAYGLLKYARRVSAEDAVGCLAFLEQGIYSGVLPVEKKTDLFPVMMDIQSERLAEIAENHLDGWDEDEFRASYIRDRLPGLNTEQ